MRTFYRIDGVLVCASCLTLDEYRGTAEAVASRRFLVAQFPMMFKAEWTVPTLMPVDAQSVAAGDGCGRCGAGQYSRV